MVTEAQSAMCDCDDESFPDGIKSEHAKPASGLRYHASPLAVLILGGLIGAALTGALGGAPSETVVMEHPAATFEVRTPQPLRSGLFFETSIKVIARQDIAKPVLGVDATLWRDLTINSQVPAPSDESFKAGQYRFEYAPLKKGGVLQIKIDGQTNPPLVGRLMGAFTLYDDDVRLARAQLSIPVLP